MDGLMIDSERVYTEVTSTSSIFFRITSPFIAHLNRLYSFSLWIRDDMGN